MKLHRLCDICGNRAAVFLQLHTGKRLCKECFINDLKNRVVNYIKRYSLLNHNDKILVGLSGGKDSYTLFKILLEIHDPAKIVGLMIEEGIKGYNREEQYVFIKSICKEFNVDCIKTDLKKELGYSVDDFMNLQHRKSLKFSACTYCGIARRRVLNYYARIYNVDKVATGHNLDDEVQTYIINILRGDIMRLIQLHPLSEVHSVSLVKRIKPLRIIYEYETAFFAYLEHYHFQETECPYISEEPTLRVRIRELLHSLESRYPGIQLKFIEYLDKILEPYVISSRYKGIELPRCINCGEPTSPNRLLCKLCELMNILKDSR